MMQNKTILLIEDSMDDALLTKRALEKTRVPVEINIAENGEEAFKYLYENQSHHNTLPDLILLDLNLPRLNGLDILKKIKSHPKTKMIPCVILSSSDEAIDVRQCIEAGANSYIQKSVDFAKFKEKADLIVRYWLGVNMSAKDYR
jgi:two-component system response regulator